MDAVLLHPWLTRSLWFAAVLTRPGRIFAQIDGPIGMSELSNRVIAQSLVEQVVCGTRSAYHASLRTRHKVITSCRDMPQSHAIPRSFD